MSEREQEIRERLEAATPGPWRWYDGYDSLNPKPDDEPGFALQGGLYSEGGDEVVGGRWRNDGHADCRAATAADAELVAHAPEDIDYLLTRLDECREALEDAAETFAQIKRRTRKYKGTRNHYCKQREMAQAAHDAAEVAEGRARRALEDGEEGVRLIEGEHREIEEKEGLFRKLLGP